MQVCALPVVITGSTVTLVGASESLQAAAGVPRIASQAQENWCRMP